ncbi:hypothetical protein OC846_003796 [Tilletia horrida]|uniref:Uncharacterized protein n=1 Tax=Tilletia horrida TaxID=155126 RepID=A0AAN6GPC4_9BASI|nr:hypothetical protein OC846_003796 [Tilletia horrida]KAK0565121.1 hypothetical protein OC861_003917 [Tilletia horrida]
MSHQRTISPVLQAWADQVNAAHSRPNKITTGAPIGELIKVIASSIVEVVILSGVGYILARRGVIDKRTQTKINKLNVSFFTPALLFSKVAFTLNPARLAELFIVPIGFVIITFVSAMAALILSKLARLSKAQRNFAIACAISPNSNSLPVALMQSLVVTVPQLRWDEAGQPKDTKDSMLGRALTYLVLFSTLGMFLRWSVGATLMSTVEEANYEEDVEEEGTLVASESYRDEPEHDPLIRFGAEDTDQHQQNGSPADAEGPIPPPISIRRATGEHDARNGEDGPAVPGLRAKPGRAESLDRNAHWARSFPNSPDDDNASPTAERDDPNDQPAARPSLFHRLIIHPLATINRFMTMPLWAAIMSLVVALIGPLQQFIDSLEPVVGALRTAGGCSIPLTMVVLGSYFYEDKSALESLQRDNHALTPQMAAMQGGNSSPEDRRGGTQTGDSTLVDRPSKRRSVPWVKNPWNSAPPSETGSRIGSSGGSASGSLSASGYLSTAQSEAGDDSLSVGTSAVSEGGPESTRAQDAWAKLAERNAARNSRKGHVTSSNSGPIGSLESVAERKSLRQQAKEKRIKTMEKRTIAVAVASRMLLTPLILLPTTAWYAIATRYNVMDDPVFITSACLLIGSPPALTLAQITSQNAAGNSGFERLISKTIFVSYAILAAPTTIALVLVALLIAQYDH